MIAQESFAERFNVSRETIDRLNAYEALIKKWNPVINLVAKSTVENVWDRHFHDSALIFGFAKPIDGKWLDLGTGGGFPGMVISILAAEKAKDLKVTCIESDIRKCEFLRTVSRVTETNVDILSRRIEDTPHQAADYVSARALAPLTSLLGLVEPHINVTGTGYFHKGENWKSEVETAREIWEFDLNALEDGVNPHSSVLEIRNIHRG